MLPHEALRAAAKLIEVGGWCRGEPGHTDHARDAGGLLVPLYVGADRARINPEAVQFTAYGAVAAIMGRERIVRIALMFDVLYRRALEVTGPPGGKNYVHPLEAYNATEGRTQAEVLAFLEAAAVECERIGDGPFPSPIPLPSKESMEGA